MTDVAVQKKSVREIRETSSILYHNFPTTIPYLKTLKKAGGGRMVSALKDNTAPLMVYMANGRIHALETLDYDQEVIDYLNEHGLHIYLYEPICSYYEGDPFSPRQKFLDLLAKCHTLPELADTEYNKRMFNNGFYSEFPDSSEMIFYRCAEFDSIQEYAQRNKLYNITVHTCDHGVEKYYQSYTTHMLLRYDDLFLRTLVFNNNVQREPKPHFEKRFINLNWRFTTSRAIVSALLCKKSVYLAWYYRFAPALLDDTPWFNFERSNSTPKFYKRLILSLSKLNAGSPWYVDMPVEEALEIDECSGSHYPKVPQISYMVSPSVYNDDDLVLEKYYRESFVDIVCETRFAQPTTNVSEKALQAMQFMTPFVLVSPPYGLKLLKEMGFRTFDQWWDESYDTELSHIKRMEKICEVMEYIHGLDDDQILTIYEEMRDTLEYNCEHLFDITNSRGYTGRYGPSETESIQWHSEDHYIELGHDETWDKDS